MTVPDNRDSNKDSSKRLSSNNDPQDIFQGYGKTFTVLLRTSIPTILYLAALNFKVVATLHFVGMKDNKDFFNGVGLANSILYCTMIYLIISLNMGFTTIAA